MSLLYSLLFFLTPLLFTSINSELFEFPKSHFVYLITLLILATHIFYWIRGKVPLFRSNYLTLPLIIFFITQILSTYFSVDIHTSIFGYYSRPNGGLLSLTCYLLLAFILPLYLTPTLKNQLLKVSLISGLLVAIYAIGQHFGLDAGVWNKDVQARAFSTLGQPNWLAAYLCLLLPLTFPQFFTYYALLVTCYFSALLFTGSKSGFIALVVAIITYLLAKFKNIHFRLILTALSLTLGLSLFLALPKTPASTDNNHLITASTDIRQIVWTGALQLWQKYPLFGTGVDTFGYAYYWVRPATHNLTSEWELLYDKAHNEFLNLLATTGTFGFLAYLFLIFTIIRHLLPYPAYLASFVAILVTNFFGFSTVPISLFFYLLPTFILPPPPPTQNETRSWLYFIVFYPTIGFLLFQALSLFFADAAFFTATNLDLRQNYPGAYQKITLALNLNPDEPLYLGQAGILAAKLAVTTKDNQYLLSAVAFADKSVKISPANTNLWKLRAQTYLFLSSLDPSFYSQAINSLIQVIKLAPTDARSYFNLGNFYQAAKLDNQAIPAYEQAISLRPNYDQALFQLGQIYFNQKNYSKAKEYFESTLKYQPKNTQAQEYLLKIK